MEGHRLAIVIPAYREAATIVQIVKRARAFGTVIVVDDASPDETASRAEAAGAIVIRNGSNLGYDETLNRGFAEALASNFDYVITIDADGEHDPTLIANFRHLLIDEQIRLVLGYRKQKQRVAEVVMGLYIRLRFGVIDILCGMKGYHLSLLEANGAFDTTHSIGTELALNSIRRGISFRQILVTGTSRHDQPRFGRRLRANWMIFAALWRVLRQDIRGHRPSPTPVESDGTNGII